MLEGRGAIKPRFKRQCFANMGLSAKAKKRVHPAFELLIKKAIYFSKQGLSRKAIAEWIKKRHNVEPKHLTKILKKVLTRLVKMGIIYMHKVKPTRYRLTIKGRIMKQALRSRAHKRKKKKQKRKKKKKRFRSSYPRSPKRKR